MLGEVGGHFPWSFRLSSALKWIHNYESKDRMLEWKMVFPNNRSGQLKFTDVEKKTGDCDP